MWKWIIGIVVVLVVLGGGGIAAVIASPLGAKLRGQQVEMGTEVALTAAERGDLVRTVSAPGSIEPRTMVEISSQVSAKVLAVPFREGDLVKEGDVVLRLDPQDLTALLASAQASLRSEEARLKGAEANLINARLNFERLTALYETGDVTKADLDGAEAGHLSAQSNKQVIEHSIEIADARIEEAQKDLDNTTITSPMDGIVTALNTEVGETVIVGTTNNPGSIVMEIADLSEMLVKAQVDEANIAPIAEGQSVTVYINAYPDREFTGTVERIGLKRQVASDGTGIFQVEILLDTEEGDRLYSGLTASVDIAVEEFFDVVRVPSQSVLDRRVDELPDEVKKDSAFVDSEKAFARVVYVMNDGKTVARPVEVGPSDLTHTVITGGLDSDERVVSGPYRVLVSIGHGQAVRDQDAEPEPAEGEEATADADEGEAADDAGSESADADEVAGG
ncbi:MAG: hemolysin secretion protein D [Phycisphaeraceae bacterium]|nr:MAG: hemolysin secretion protein D [Phycisphaeraceae bacterium]